jgi:hypothetical protein
MNRKAKKRRKTAEIVGMRILYHEGTEGTYGVMLAAEYAE